MRWTKSRAASATSRRVMACHFTQETRVQNAFEDVASNVCQASPVSKSNIPSFSPTSTCDTALKQGLTLVHPSNQPDRVFHQLLVAAEER